MRVLVTGGAGFIGANFILRQLERQPGLSVINLDALTYAGCRESLASLEGNPRHEFVHGDILDEALLRTLMPRVDGVINFAAESHVDRSLKDPELFLRTNILGVRTLLDAVRHENARRGGSLRFHQIGTDEVYGDLGESGGFFREDTPLEPSSPYSASKTSADLLVGAWRRTFGLDAVITRCSNNYGPLQFPEKLIPLMIWKAERGESLPVYGQGLNVRDWLYVDDHVDAIWEVFTRAENGSVYNIGGANEWRNIDIVKLILQELGRPESLIQFVQDRPGHDMRYAIDAAKIRRELGWSPAVDFASGLKKTITWYREHTEWADALRLRVHAGQ
ncbi:MAG: dTDP-glucose 4,6-dehydratase [Candidatus Delongbacteria bacterium]|nr:dTDP-glucose 4,6-dehydratase [Candidatus Cloacimonadota bacterium]MCB9473177.1 dTDP-glucose 4,6-dehydratase [Candidatus Delongbacteria bacterium]